MSNSKLANKTPEKISTDPWSYHVEISTESSKIHSYFSAVQSRFWTFEHYINWICKNAEPPIWTTCVEQFYESLRMLNKIKVVPLSVRAYVKSLVEIMNEMETQDTMKVLEKTYIALIKERQGKMLSKTLLHAQTDKATYADATGVVGSKRQANLKEVSHEQKKRRTDAQDTDNITDATDVDEDSCNDLSKLDFMKFDESYLAMDPEKMWKLKSGRKVEEIIHQFAKKLHKESCLHSFIINDTDKNAESLFSKEEWKEIFFTSVKKKPKVEVPLRELISKYTLDNISDLRKTVFQPFIPDGFEFNRNLHYNLDYINYAYRGMLLLWEMEDSFTSDPSKLEGWFQHNVWSRLIDPAFHDMKVELIRGEGMSLASSDRKNEGRTISGRKKIGKKGDGIFRITKDRMEFGAIETGRKWEGLKGTKYLKDSLKLNKMLKDMLTQLVAECDRKDDIIRQLQVIGMLNGGNRLQIITMDTPKGYICRVERGKIYEVNGRLSMSQPLAFVVKEILRTKAIFMQTLDLINNNKLSNLFNDDTDDDDVEDNSRSSTPPPFALPKTFPTPHTSRVENKLKI
ncbi:8463_t:CDS:2 [Ambispora gerdemannii]|uniref:8463_t:CDS:1 n=1 Tax=Ambispora gerdemannii TaxID=144530 RepID=A0A9N8Z589_9GLOM|nr:8463_t:CDS:2 [Ambispora gerdemannii]